MLLLYTCIIQLITEYGSALYKGGIFVFSFSSILPVSQSSFNLVCGCSITIRCTDETRPECSSGHTSVQFQTTPLEEKDGPFLSTL